MFHYLEFTIDDDQIKQLKTTLSSYNIEISDLEYIDSGCFGSAFSSIKDETIVIKFTKDLNELEIANKLKGNKTSYFADIYQVLYFSDFGVIIQEKLDVKSFKDSEEYKITSTIVNFEFLFCELLINENVFYLATENLDQQDFFIVSDFIDWCRDINIKLYDLTKTEKNDVHLNNIGYKKDGNLAFLDLSYHNYY